MDKKKQTVINMGDINPTISAVTLNGNGLMHQLKEIVRVDQKNNTQIYVVYKKSILNIKIHLD